MRYLAHSLLYVQRRYQGDRLTILMQTKANGLKRLVYSADVPARRRGLGHGKPQCEATGCQEPVHFRSTGGLCIKCGHKSRTEPVRRKCEYRKDGHRRSVSTQRKQRLEAKKARA